jgi:hypothetical protein
MALAAAVGCGSQATTKTSAPQPTANDQTSPAAADATRENEPKVPAKAVVAEAPEPERAPATVTEAAKVLDLRALPRLKEEEPDALQTLAQVHYQTAAKTKEAFAFHQKQLLDQGWKELPNTQVSDESVSGTFTREGFNVSLSVSSFGGQPTTVMLHNHGNVALGRLPVPPGAKQQYAFALTTSYVTDASPEETAAAVKKLLTDLQWMPYGSAGDSQIYRQNAVQLDARVFKADGLGGKTVIDYTSDLLSAELPAPDDAIGLQYSEPPVQLFYDTPKSMAEVYTFYKDALASATWQPTTEGPVKIDFRHFFILRNKAKDLIDVQLSEFEGKTRVLVKYQTAAEVEETERRIKEELAKKKEKEKENKPTKEAAKTQELALPPGVRGLKENSTSDWEFSVPAGKAKAAVEALRKQLLDAGYKEVSAQLDATNGNVLLMKGEATINLLYIDVGVVAPEIHVNSQGVELKRAK